MNKKEYSLVLIKAWKSALKEIIELATPLSSVISLVEKQQLRLKFEDKDGIFFFIIRDPYQSNDKIYCKIERAPHTVSSNNGSIDSFPVSSAITIFNHWLGLVGEYESITIFEENSLLEKQYEEEFYDEFEIIDEDSQTSAFDLKRQILLYNYLQYVEKVFEKDAPEEVKAELVESAKSLKAQLSQLTKKETIKALSKILSKARKAGINIIKQIWEEGKKEAIKRLIKYGTENIETFINNHNLFNH